MVHGHIPTGIERLIQTVKSGKALTPEVVLDGDPTAKLILMLADIYHEVEQYKQSLNLCNRVLTTDAPNATPEQKSWALFRRGRNNYCLEGADQDVDASITDYLAAVKASPTATWADDALFLVANIKWNVHHDADAAVRYWKDIVRLYPNSEEAGRSAYYIGVAYQWSDRPKDARRAFDEFLASRPDSYFATEVRNRIRKLETPKEKKGRPKQTRQENEPPFRG